MSKEQIYLFATAGNGPIECALALAGILERLQENAEKAGFVIEIDRTQAKQGIGSALISLKGIGVQDFAQSWTGTIQWQCPSPIRKGHKRKNWFIGIYPAPDMPDDMSTLPVHEVTFETFRAGGPGGQHQNTTDSAVRARWGKFMAVSRSERSQHRNKAVALKRLALVAHGATQLCLENAKGIQHAMHYQIERGKPVRCFIGPKFHQKC